MYELMQGMFDRGWLTNNGPLVIELERRLAEYLKVRHCILTCNGTVALELAIRGVGMEGEVIVPSMTFVASAHSLQWQGIRPVFCDIDRRTYCIDPEQIERHISEKTTGIMGVHLYGRPCDVTAIRRIADRQGLRVIYDACHALGVSEGGTMIGNFGDCEVFSFHATKLFNTFEGGAVTTNDDELAERLKFMRNFGFAGEDSVVYIGVNGKMPEICAAMGLTNLDSLGAFIEVNKRNVDAYARCLDGIAGIELMPFDTREANNFQYVIIEVDEAAFGTTRDALYKALRVENILARRYFYPGCHQMEPYRTIYPDASAALRNTEEFSSRVLALPTGTQVSVALIETVCDVIRESKPGAQ
jgi:dTDP-4-amino-4,6-dideoxygalactose transaminase